MALTITELVAYLLSSPRYIKMLASGQSTYAIVNQATTQFHCLDRGAYDKAEIRARYLVFGNREAAQSVTA